MTKVRSHQPDGGHLPKIKEHSLEKLDLHNRYAEIFAGGMRKQWANLVYVGLYSGSGAAEVEGTGQVVMTSGLSVLTQDVPFDRYVFVDEDPDCVEALRDRANAVGMADRVTLVPRDVNSSVDDVLKAPPDWRRDGGVLTFCFIDPYKINLDFEVIRRMSHLKIDILLMVPLGYDVRRNWRDYLDKPVMRDRLSRFLGETGWVEDWQALGRPYTAFPAFVQDRLNAAMKGLGFIEVDRKDIKDVKVARKNVYLYSLHLFSKSEVAIKFWRESLKGTSAQRTLGL